MGVGIMDFGLRVKAPKCEMQDLDEGLSDALGVAEPAFNKVISHSDAFLDALNTSFLRNRFEFRTLFRLPTSKCTLCSLVKRVLGCLDAAL